MDALLEELRQEAEKSGLNLPTKVLEIILEMSGILGEHHIDILYKLTPLLEKSGTLGKKWAV